MRRIFYLGLLIFMAGCQSVSQNEDPKPILEPDATEALALQWEKGSYQVDVASALLADLREDLAVAAKDSTGSQKEDLLDVADAVESVGQQVAEFVTGPTKAEIKKDFAQADEDRLAAITTLNEALVETREAMDLANQLPPELADAIGANLDEAVRAIEESIRTLGGQVRPPE